MLNRIQSLYLRRKTVTNLSPIALTTTICKEMEICQCMHQNKNFAYDQLGTCILAPPPPERS